MAADNGNWPWAWDRMAPAGPYPVRQTVHFGGWACPGCQRCYSPAVTECPHCQPATTQREACTCGTTIACPAHQVNRSRIVVTSVGDPPGSLGGGSVSGSFHLCPSPRAGGMCGCDEDDGPGDCLQARCGC